MFTRATELRSGAGDAPAPLSAGFDQLRTTVGTLAGPGADVETEAEVLWAALHGLALLERAGRLRPGKEADRVRHLASRFQES